MSEHKYLTEEQIGDFYLSHPRTVGPMHSDILALRAELKAAQEERDTYRLAMLGVNDTYKECKSELDRMRKALEPFANCVFNDNGDLTIDQSHLHGGDWLRAYRALNQQPAQYKTPETPWRPSSLYNGYEERINGNGHLEMRPQPAQQEKP